MGAVPRDTDGDGLADTHNEVVFLGKSLSMLACLKFMLTRRMHGEGTFLAAGWWGNPRVTLGTDERLHFCELRAVKK